MQVRFHFLWEIVFQGTEMGSENSHSHSYVYFHHDARFQIEKAMARFSCGFSELGRFVSLEEVQVHVGNRDALDLCWRCSFSGISRLRPWQHQVQNSKFLEFDSLLKPNKRKLQSACLDKTYLLYLAKLIQDSVMTTVHFSIHRQLFQA